MNGTVERVNSGDYDTLTAVPDQGYYFVGWQGDVTGTTNPVIVEEGAVVEAVFARKVLNSFASLEEADAYWQNRSSDVWGDSTTDMKEQALELATEYIELHYNTEDVVTPSERLVKATAWLAEYILQDNQLFGVIDNAIESLQTGDVRITWSGRSASKRIEYLELMLNGVLTRRKTMFAKVRRA